MTRKTQMVHVLGTMFLVLSCHWSGTCVGALPVPPCIAHPPQATEIGTAGAAGLSKNVLPPPPPCLRSESGLRSTIVYGYQSITQDEEPTGNAKMSQPVGRPEKRQQEGDGVNIFEESPSMDVQIVTSYIAEQPDLSSTLTLTTPEDSALVGPSVGPGWSGNGAIDGWCICSPQPTSGPPPSAPVNGKRSAGSSLMQHELRDGNDDDDGPLAYPIVNGTNPGPNPVNPGGNGPPGQGPGQKSTGIQPPQPPPVVMQWIQCVLVTAQLVWMTISQVMSWGSRCISRRKAAESDKPGDKQPADAEPDCEDEKAPADTPGDSKASIADSQQLECSGEERWKYAFDMILKLTQYIGKGPQGPPCH